MNENTYRQLAQFDLNLLTSFLVIQRERHITKAAKVVGVSQPAMSHALGRMREMLGDELFVKTPQGMVPTPKAERLAPEVEKILESLHRVLKGNEDFSISTMARTFRIQATDFIESLLSPQLIKLFADKSPASQLSFTSAGFSLPKQELEEGKCDIAIAGFFGDLPVGFFRQPLFKDDFVCCVRKDHPTFKRKLSLDDYASGKHLLIAPTGELKGKVDQVLNKQKKNRTVISNTSSFMSAGYVVSETDCILTAPSKLVAQFSKFLPIKVLPLPITVQGISIVQVWHERNHNDEGHKWLRSEMRRIAENR